jgi:hypothetical protein
LNSLTIEWIGADIVNNLLMPDEVIHSLGCTVPVFTAEKEKFEFPDRYSVLQGPDYPRADTHRPNRISPRYIPSIALMALLGVTSATMEKTMAFQRNGALVMDSTRLFNSARVAEPIRSALPFLPRTVVPLRVKVPGPFLKAVSRNWEAAQIMYSLAKLAPTQKITMALRPHSSLRLIAQEYRQRTGERLYFNDMSLPPGGIFDINSTWAPPHIEHRNGASIDISAVPGTTMNQEQVFLEILKKYTSNHILEGAGPSRHYHVRF